ncbi:hypothetical protein [Bacillus sp. 'calajunan']|uniref:hypothetical protein n=1 Tax=Bacillus sp. 'calajunan' TaxID=3447457 RepID=UPI003EDE9FD6
MEMMNQKESMKYAWNKKGVQAYESPFSIFQKLMFANIWSFKELYRELGSPEFKSSKIPLISYKFGNLYTLDDFGINEIFCRLCIDLQFNRLNISTHIYSEFFRSAFV